MVINIMNGLHNLTSVPLVTIVMAVYHSREDWLIQQLISLDKQTYKNLELIICDDGPDLPVNHELFQKYVNAFPWRLIANQTNIGSNKTFERLTALATGKYIAYCDQDDIWEENKIELLVQRIEKTGAELCCSDLSIIDENGKLIAGSITKVRKRHVFKEGANLAPQLIVNNFVTGCAMIMKADTAKAAIPFEEYMVHDHWLALYSALHGEIAFEPTATVKYRQHCDNQTTVLAGVKTKEEYYRLRIELLYNRVCSLKSRLGSNKNLLQTLNSVYKWVLARRNYFYNPGIKNARQILKYREFGLAPSFFEMLMPLMPKPLFGKIINYLR